MTAMPAPLTYLDFDLSIQRQEAGYRARVLNSPGGQGSAVFTLPFSDIEIENLLLKMGHTRTVRGMRNPALDAAKKLGGGLFTNVFAGEVARCWQSSITTAQAANNGLRVRLRLNDAPELGDLPWEFLYDPVLNNFFDRSVETPLVRFLEQPALPRALRLQPPMRILVVISLPKDVPALDAEREWTNLQTALADAIKRGTVILERTTEATLAALQRQLRLNEYHVLHFIGHGGYDEDAQESVLVLEGEQGQARQVGRERLGVLLHDHTSLRLVVLNACEGARAGRQDPFSGVAQTLIQQRIPAVVAMQFAITDDAALVLSRTFYEALADGYPIDAALSEARKAVYLEGNETEWATPVLYLSAPDGVIFEVGRTTVDGGRGTDEGRTTDDPSTPLGAGSGPLSSARGKLPTPPSDTSDFVPVGRWNIQVQDMVGSKLFVEFAANGTFRMIQQVGTYQVPVNGTWTFQPTTRQLALQGVVNTFQPFVLSMNIGGAMPDGYSAVGSDGITYLLTRA